MLAWDFLYLSKHENISDTAAKKNFVGKFCDIQHRISDIQLM